MKNWEDCGRKRPWPSCRYYPSFYLNKQPICPPTFAIGASDVRVAGVDGDSSGNHGNKGNFINNRNRGNHSNEDDHGNESNYDNQSNRDDSRKFGDSSSRYSACRIAVVYM